MNIANKTVLITGGGSGIGFETAKLLSEKGNRILIIGRDGGKLARAAAALNNVSYLAIDITRQNEVDGLHKEILSRFSELSVVINNAAASFVYAHADGVNAFDKASQEMLTNYLSVIRLNETLLPVLKKQPEAAIVNVTSLVSIAPVTVIPTYSDTKAALHSYTLALRHELGKDTAVKVFELLPPLVNTDFSKEIGGEANGIPAADVAKALLQGITEDLEEIYVGQTKDFRTLYLSDPKTAFQTLNQTQVA